VLPASEDSSLSGTNSYSYVGQNLTGYVDFGLAQEVFLDPLRITMETQDVDGEERFVTIGSITGTFRLMVMVYTLRLKDDRETIRIISARKATPNERKFYEKAHQI
jgi:uncharacterized DUF497 family protein